MINQIREYIQRKTGTIHFWSTKITSAALIFLVPAYFLYLILSSDHTFVPTVVTSIWTTYHIMPFVMFTTCILLLWHLRGGLETILHDYVHDEIVIVYITFCIRIGLIQVFKYLYELSFLLG